MIKKLTFVGAVSLLLSWNALAGEPELLAAYSTLKNHITGSATLSASEISAQRAVVQNNAAFAGNSTASITASFDLVDTYESRNATIFTDEISRTDDTNVLKSLRLAMVEVHQAIIDDVYNASNLASNRSLLDGFKFDSADKFPGEVPSPADPLAVYSVQINASQPTAYGYPVDFGTLPARRPTGAYLAPGDIGTVTVPSALVGKGFEIRVGAHVADLSNRPNNLKRFNRVTLTYPINSTETEIVSPLGGGIYIEVPYEMEEGLVTVEFENIVRSPFYSNTVARQTTLAEWQSTERSFPGPWTDFETDKFMLTLPTAWIYNYEDPVTLMDNWDLSMDACSDLQGLPRVRPKTVLYCIIDVTLDAAVFSPGYPQSNDNFDPTPRTPYNGNQNHDYLRGPQFTDDVDFHEFGHAASITKFTNETEALVNFFYVPVQNRFFNMPFDEAFGRSLNSTGGGRMDRRHAAINWAVKPKFSNDEPMALMEMRYQHRGYAKYAEVAALFGWDAIGDFYKSVAEDYEIGITYPKNTDPTDSRIVRMSNAANANLLPLIHFWGVHPDNASSIEQALEYQGIKPSAAIYDRLKYYQSVIPMSPAEFTAHSNAVRNLINVNEQSQYDINKDEWTPEQGQDAVDAIQRIIDLYFPDGRPVEPLPHYEDFEDGIGGWAQATDDDHEWRLNSGPTLTTAAGPDAAAGGEYYMYSEGHDASGADKTASFLCTFDFSTVQPTVLSFDYHMYGSFIDFMSVDIHDGSSWTNDVWKKTGQQQSSSSAPWESATIDLTSFTGNDEVTVRFRTKNTRFNAADPAIDNVRIDVPLPTLPLADSFEDGLDSSWVKSTGADSFFVINSGDTPTAASGPGAASDGSNYIYAEGHTGIVGFKTAGIERRFDFSNAENAVLNFDYHMYGGQIDFLSVDIYDGSHWDEDVWRREGQQQNSSDAPWANASIDLSAYSGEEEVTVRFRTKQLRFGASDVAIDNVSLNADVGPVPPVATDLSVSGPGGTGIPITLIASDPNDDALTYTVVTPPSSGELAGSAPTLTYTPDAGFLGMDTFTFTANDGVFDSDPATVLITINSPNFVFSTDFGNSSLADVSAADLDSVSTSGGTWDTDFSAVANHALVANAGDTDYALLLDSFGQSGSASGTQATLTLDSPADFSTPLVIDFDLGASRGGAGKTFEVTGLGPDGSTEVFKFSFDFQNYPVEVLTASGMRNLSQNYFIFASATGAYDPGLLKTFSVVLDGNDISYGADGLTPVVGSIPNSQTALGSIKWEITGGVTTAQGIWLDNVNVERLSVDDPFAAWAAGFGLGGADASALADSENGTGDGYANFVEYALGMDPTIADSPFGTITLGDAGFTIDYRRRILDDVEVTLEWSSDLQDPWVTDGIVETVTGALGEVENITASIPSDTDKKFVRIRVVE